MLPLRDNVPTRSFPVVTVTIIAICVVVWLWEWKTGVDKQILEYGYYPCSVHGPCGAPASEVQHEAWLPSVFSSMFMHASWIHIGGNMLFLWIFGNNVEDAMGRVRYAIFYLLAGFAATALQTVVTLHWAGVEGASVPNIGASGAIAGVLGAYIILLPNARVLTAIFVFFVFFWEIPAGDRPRLLVPAPDLRGRDGPHAPRLGRRRRVLRPRRRLRLRGAHGQGVHGAAAAPAHVRPVSFEDEVRQALDELPPEIARRLENVAVVVEDENPEEPDLFGLFEEEEWLPAQVTIYRRPLEESFPDRAELHREIRITVLHELAHYFGIDEDRLDELGYG